MPGIARPQVSATVLGRVAGAAHRGDHGLGHPERGEHRVEAELGPAPHALDQHDGHHRGAGDREAQRGQVVLGAVGCREQRLVDVGAPGSTVIRAS